MRWLSRAPSVPLPELPLLRLQQPGRVTTLVARLLLAGIIATAIALALAPWQQSSFGQGNVVAFAPMDRQQIIDAPIDGRVARVHVVEGTRVEEGQPLVEIVDIDPNYVDRLETKRGAAVAGLEAALKQEENYFEQVEAYESSRTLSVRAARLKVEMAGQRVQAADQRVAAAEAELTTAELNLSRLEALAERGLTSQRSLELAELDVAKALTAVKSARAVRSEATANETALKAELLKVDAEGRAKVSAAKADGRKAASVAADKRTEVAKLDVTLSRQRSRIVKAPRSGTILRITGNLGGQVVESGDELAVLVPDTASRSVELWVDGNDAPLVTLERSVRIQFEGWPAVQFVGWPSVAVGTFGGRVAFVDAMSRKDGKLRVVVIPDPMDAPWPDARYLRQGARAKGWILLDQVPLGWELWRLFNGFPQSVASPEDVAAADTATAAGAQKP